MILELSLKFTSAVKNSLFTNNWQCCHQNKYLLNYFLKQNAGDNWDNSLFCNDPFLHVDCFFKHSQEVPMKVSYFDRHFHFEIINTDQFGKVLETLDGGCNRAITRAGFFDWTKPISVERTQIRGWSLVRNPQHTTTRNVRTEAVRA